MVPPSFFFYFAQEWMFKKLQRPPFTFFGTLRLNQKNLKKIRLKKIPHAGTVEENN